MKMKLFLTLLGLAVLLLALGGWTVRGARRALRGPALRPAGSPRRAAGASPAFAAR